MENDVKTPKTDALHRMSYSELKKMAKKHGIKGNMKAEKIIAALRSLDSDSDECFSTPAEKEKNSSRNDINESFSTPAQRKINSSRKNKEEKFNEDKLTPLPTPRRGTYSKDEQESLKVEDTSLAPIAFDSSVLDMSNITVGRGSERKLRRKVSFMSPARTPSTPKNPSIKLRPKTPIASRASVGKRVSFSSPAEQQKSKSFEKPLHSTPHPKTSLGRRRSFLNTPDVSLGTPLPSVTELSEKEDVTHSLKQSETDDNKSSATKSLVTRSKAASKAIQFATPVLNTPGVSLGTPLPSVSELSEKQDVTHSLKQSETDDHKSSASKSLVTRSQSASKAIQFATPGSSKSKKLLVPKGDAGKIKRLATPNFQKIHEKAFEKMESIDDYQKRKEHNSAKKILQRPDFKSKVTKAKSRIPAFSGIPFISSVSSAISKTVNEDSKPKTVVPSLKIKNVKRANENAKKSKSKFDLKASLSRKLGYTPYKGALKPLAESNTFNTSSTSCFHHPKRPVNKPKEPVNKVVTTNRLQTRSMLKGVRTNKRFELQMKNRKVD